MKKVVFIICLLTSIASKAGGKEILRSLYMQAVESEVICDSLLKITAGVDLKENPLLFAYHGAALMIKAKHRLSPFKKFAFFTEGKEDLELAIAANPDDIELRILRYTLQKEVPKFLDYYQNIEEDHQIIFTSKKGVNIYNEFK
tara:strand:- start:239 stop:670 length:432 start_codon:yes stop_codon:yes gene_type:complete